jgi:hypothetical protein
VTVSLAIRDGQRQVSCDSFYSLALASPDGDLSGYDSFAFPQPGAEHREIRSAPATALTL